MLSKPTATTSPASPLGAAVVIAIAIAASLTACTAGDERRSLEGDPTTEARTTANACDRGDELACTNLGIFWRDGEEGLPGDRDRAIALFESACRDGALMACINAARLYLDHLNNPQRAGALYEQSCQRGDRGACFELGLFLRDGHSGPPDHDRARELFEDTCDRRVGAACEAFARYFLDGPDTDLDRAAGLLDRGCLHGSMRACTRLGDLMRTDDPPEASMRDPKMWYRRGCAGGDGKGCWRAADWLEEFGAEEDARRIEAFRERACEFGYERACRANANEDQ